MIIRQRGNVALVIVTGSRMLWTADVDTLCRYKQVNLMPTQLGEEFTATTTIGIHSAINATSRLLGFRVR